MTKHSLISFSLFTLLSLGAALPAAAKEIRFPDTGDVYYSVELPDSWAASPGQDKISATLMPVKPDAKDIKAISLVMENSQPPLELKPAVFKGLVEPLLKGINPAGKDDLATDRVVSFSGMNWDEYDTKVPASPTVIFNAKLMVCADAAHVLTITPMHTAAEMPKEQADILQSIKVVGISTCALNDAAK